jgi:type I restriction enzyme S subunit
MTWLTAPLRKVAPPVAAKIVFSPDDRVWQLSLDQIESETGEIVGKRYAAASDAGTSTFCFDAGNVLYSKLRPYLNKVAIPDEAGIATTELIPLRPDPKTLNPRFLAYYLRSPGFVNQASHHVAGAKMPRVVMDWFWEHEAPIPSPKEQSRIVELLDEADRLRRIRREADAKAARILPALFLKMFGDPATNPMRWPETTVGALLESTDYGTSTKASDEGKGLPLIRMGNVAYDGTLQLSDLKYVELGETEATKYRLQHGDILFNRTNSKELVGKTGLWDSDLDAVLASYFIRLRVNREFVEPMFLWALMNSSHMKRVLQATARGAIGQANINTGELRALPTYIPPLFIQQSFVATACAIRAVIPERREHSDLEELFDLIMQRAFSGQLTAKWREDHMQELLEEMSQQGRALNPPQPRKLEARS